MPQLLLAARRNARRTAPVLLLSPQCLQNHRSEPMLVEWLDGTLASARRALAQAFRALQTGEWSLHGTDWLHRLLGQEPHTITWWQMSIRGVVLFIFALFLVRIARRAFERAAPVDIILSVLIGSNLSRAFTANAAFTPTLAATAVLVAVYWLFILASMRSRAIARLVKGRQYRLVHDGELDRSAMARHGITVADLREAMRSSGIRSLDEVEAAYLERNGSISLLRRRG